MVMCMSPTAENHIDTNSACKLLIIIKLSSCFLEETLHCNIQPVNISIHFYPAEQQIYSGGKTAAAAAAVVVDEMKDYQCFLCQALLK